MTHNTNHTPHIFITGIFRSGTTLLTRSLAAHTKVDITYQPFTSLFRAALEKFWLSSGYQSPRPMGDPELLERFYEEFTGSVLSMNFTQDEIANIKDRVRKDYKIDSAEKRADARKAFDKASGDTFFELFISALFNLKDISGCGKETVTGIKEIWCEDFLPAFLSQNSVTIKCIHLIRDPRAIVVSRNYGNYLRKSCGGQKYPLLFIARSWRRSVSLHRKLQGSANYFPVHYEDLVRFPEKVLREICDFLGIDFDRKTIDFSQYKGEDGKPWHGNIDSRKFTNIDSDSSTRWEKIISENDLFLCEFLCSAEMEYEGYTLLTDAKDTKRFLSLDEDNSAGNSWLCQLGHCLTGEQKSLELRRKELLN